MFTTKSLLLVSTLLDKGEVCSEIRETRRRESGRLIFRRDTFKTRTSSFLLLRRKTCQAYARTFYRLCDVPVIRTIFTETKLIVSLFS